VILQAGESARTEIRSGVFASHDKALLVLGQLDDKYVGVRD
jgi:hypothetical protein